jgi:hypothetical protein
VQVLKGKGQGLGTYIRICSVFGPMDLEIDDP